MDKQVTPEATKSLLDRLFNPEKAQETAKKILSNDKPSKPPRTLGDPYLALECQKAYNPQTPSVVRPAPANLMNKGVGPSLDTEGSWGSPAVENK